ncbi:LysR substrate-binding domain-containing protein [Pseudomonas sp. KK4]|uniref:LysR substrate-binding domain-containing protein n=1 Tax=Pseudomonas sp. KK4 TaxID=1855729 RepID=UPI00097C37E6|nr:LysR substrate-binding domain-containing protein [Pseudomonas sp. KK4]
MNDLNDLYYFVLVVRHGGFSPAARATGIEKTLLSRHIAFLEKRIGARLLHRTTRQVSLTEAGQHFYALSQAVVEGAQTAYESVEHMRREPVGLVRLSCPQVMAKTYLSPLLPRYMATFPKVRLELSAVDREVDLYEERLDIALRARTHIEESAGLVAKTLGSARRLMVASPGFLDRLGRPATVRALSSLPTLCLPADLHDGSGRWLLHDGANEEVLIPHTPCLISDDLSMQMDAALNGLGVAMLPEPIVVAAVRAGALEVVMPAWAGPPHLIHLLYPKPKGMLPSVRSVIDYLGLHLPQLILEGTLAHRAST